MKKYKIAILALIIGIVALAVVNGAAAADEKVSFHQIKLTVPDGLQHKSDSHNLDIYDKNKQYVFIINDDMTIKEFDDTYNALSNGSVKYEQYLSLLNKGNTNLTATNLKLEEIQGHKTLTVTLKNATGDNIAITKSIRTPEKVYIITYLENNENAKKIYDSMEIK